MIEKDTEETVKKMLEPLDGETLKLLLEQYDLLTKICKDELKKRNLL